MRRLFGCALLCLSTWTLTASAKVTETTSYTKEQAINSAFRYLRVDSAYKITERDLELGYLLFEYPTGRGNQTTMGSLEVIQRDDEVLLIVQIRALPSYHESVLIRGLVSKLRADYGEPEKARKEKPADPPSDSEEDSAKDSDKKDKSSTPDAPVRRYRIK